MADKWGRKISLMANGAITIVGVVLQAAASGSLPCMYVGRYVYPRLLYQESIQCLTHTQRGCRSRRRRRLHGRPPLHFRKRTSRHPRRIDRHLPALHRYGNHAIVLGQLRFHPAPPRPHILHRTPRHASPTRRPPHRLHLPEQRIPPLPRQTGPVGRSHQSPLSRAPPPTFAPLHPSRTRRDLRATRARTPTRRRLVDKRPSQRNVHHPR
jgi:hypothetical protein